MKNQYNAKLGLLERAFAYINFTVKNTILIKLLNFTTLTFFCLKRFEYIYIYLFCFLIFGQQRNRTFYGINQFFYREPPLPIGSPALVI